MEVRDKSPDLGEFGVQIHPTFRRSGFEGEFIVSRTSYLALGDSITCGVGATAPANGFAQGVADALAQSSLCAGWQSIAGPHWTTQNLLRTMRSLDTQVWEQARVVTVLIGGNDLRRRYYSFLSHPATMQAISRAVDSCGHMLAHVLELVKEQGIPCVVVGTLYNPLPHAHVAVSAVTRLNEQIAWAASRSGCHVVDLYSLFLGHEHEWIAQYRTGHMQDLATPFCRPIHPNDEGHQVIASAMLNKVLEVLACEV
ncbi:SGNH/GDSL hydrolase family protein [Alicyclobacillus pomorum]|uniref:SGNH/GDSL hydrolase family protein n=1 Tax=Alicyclobacillus pomorum TaxID=204470 RepID=UPI0003FE70F7|nr:SGNH/GDSL hydrolase family protein [Alicyclobacillus pomorum]